MLRLPIEDMIILLRPTRKNPRRDYLGAVISSAAIVSALSISGLIDNG